MTQILREKAGATVAAPASDYYLQVEVELTRDRIPVAWRESEVEPVLVNPFTFLTGLGGYRGDEVAWRPFVAIVVGEYGYGKTSLMLRLVEHCRNRGDPETDPRPLFINLARCGHLPDDLGPESFRAFLFAQLGQGRWPTLEEIRAGDVLLHLDGLDELTSDARQHVQFFHGLLGMLRRGEDDDGADAAYSVVVSMRLEYLTSVTRDDASELTALIRERAPGPVNVYFLSLNALSDAQQRTYLEHRFAAHEELWGRISQHPALKTTLRRPLLLRIFSDLARDRPEVLDNPGAYAHPAALVEKFVEVAAEDRLLTEHQRAFTPYLWDTDRLAQKSLQLYREWRSELTVDDLRAVLRPNPHAEGPVNAVENVDPEEVLMGVHKCPFLKRDSGKPDVPEASPGSDTRQVVRFSHRVFFEYFTARGMVPRTEDGRVTDPDEPARGMDGWSAGPGGRHRDSDDRFFDFDELVLNVDMRKFLRWMMDRIGPGAWYDRTRKSYALPPHDHGQWPGPPSAEMFRKLDCVRRNLLDLMTDPEEILDGREKEAAVEDDIEWFLRQEPGLHARYRIYNYEAVGVYVRRRRGKMRADAIADHFSEMLRRRLHEIFAGTEKIASPNDLLVERILDVGQRLRLGWTKEFERRHGEELLLRIGDDDSPNRKRMRAVLEQVRLYVY